MISQVNATPNAIAKGSLFIAVPPVQVSNYLTRGNGQQILNPYLRVSSKALGMSACKWMPRVRDALFIALNGRATKHQRTLTTDGKAVDRILTEAVQQAIPESLVIGVVTFDAHDIKATRAEKHLKKKLRCKKSRTRKARHKRTRKSIRLTTWTRARR